MRQIGPDERSRRRTWWSAMAGHIYLPLRPQPLAALLHSALSNLDEEPGRGLAPELVRAYSSHAHASTGVRLHLRRTSVRK